MSTRRRGMVIGSLAVVGFTALATYQSIGVFRSTAAERRDASIQHARAERIIDVTRRLLASGGAELGPTLDRGEVMARERLADDPLALATVLRSLARMQLRAGDGVAAQQLAASAHEMLRLELGREDPLTLVAAVTLAHVLLSNGDLIGAETFAWDAMRGLRAAFGSDSREAMASVALVGTVLDRLGRHHEASMYMDETLAWRRDTLGESDPRTREVMADLGYNALYRGNFEQAEQLLKATLDDVRPTLRPLHLARLAQALRDQERWDEALDVYERSAVAHRLSFGVDDHRTQTLDLDRGITMRAAGKLGLARAHFDEMLAVSPENQRVRVQLGATLAQLGELDEALLLLKSGAQALGDTMGTDHALTLDAESWVTWTLLEMDQLERAEPLILGLYERQRDALGLGHPATASTLRRAIELYRRLGDDDRVRLYRILLVESERTGVPLPGGDAM